MSLLTLFITKSCLISKKLCLLWVGKEIMGLSAKPLFKLPVWTRVSLAHMHKGSEIKKRLMYCYRDGHETRIMGQNSLAWGLSPNSKIKSNQIKSNQTKPNQTYQNKQTKKAMTKKPKQTQTREGSINSPNTPTITKKWHQISSAKTEIL